MPEERESDLESTDSNSESRNPPSAIRNEVTRGEILTIEQVADYLQLHPQVVYRHVRAGTLPASRIGRTIRFKKSVLDAFLERDAWQAAGRFLAFVETEKSKVSAAHARAISMEEVPRALSSEVEREPRAVKKFSVDVD